jgi:acetylornithine deacetylase/succinyl-diaminopimelate desuccinylase-like protein
VAERAAALAGLEVEHDSAYLAPPLPPESSALLHAWMAPTLRRLGLDAEAPGRPTPRTPVTPYATDASHYAGAGAQVLVLGPGDIAQAHTRDEWLDRRELAQAYRLYLELLRQA